METTTVPGAVTVSPERADCGCGFIYPPKRVRQIHVTAKLRRRISFLWRADLALNVDELALRIEKARTEWIERKAKEKEKQREDAKNIRETAIALREFFQIKDEKRRSAQDRPLPSAGAAACEGSPR
jgi:hypothetical protein